MRAHEIFEKALEEEFGDRVKTDEGLAISLWSALTNIRWHHIDGFIVSYTFRASGELVAAMVGGRKTYMDYYCCGPHTVISQEIKDAMYKHGWHGREIVFQRAII